MINESTRSECEKPAAPISQTIQQVNGRFLTSVICINIVLSVTLSSTSLIPKAVYALNK